MMRCDNCSIKKIQRLSYKDFKLKEAEHGTQYLIVNDRNGAIAERRILAMRRFTVFTSASFETTSATNPCERELNLDSKASWLGRKYINKSSVDSNATWAYASEFFSNNFYRRNIIYRSTCQ